MIISGGSRSNWQFFAKHLVKAVENERVEVAEIRGLVADTVRGALQEMDAIAEGTRCRNSFYHANINTRADEHLNPEQWQQAVDALERNLGLTGHARFVVEHSKEGRTHRHVVWSRIDPDTMTATSDSHNYRAHEKTSRELEELFGHEAVASTLLRDSDIKRPDRRPDNWETFRGKRSGIDPQAVKEEVTALWNASDSGSAFAAALEAQGYLLCRGDRRDFVIIDAAGDDHALSKCIDGARAAAVRTRMADIGRDALPSVAEGRDLARAHLRAVEEAQHAAQEQLDKAEEKARQGRGAEERAGRDKAGRGEAADQQATDGDPAPAPVDAQEQATSPPAPKDPVAQEEQQLEADAAPFVAQIRGSGELRQHGLATSWWEHAARGAGRLYEGARQFFTGLWEGITGRER